MLLPAPVLVALQVERLSGLSSDLNRVWGWANGVLRYKRCGCTSVQFKPLSFAQSFSRCASASVDVHVATEGVVVAHIAADGADAGGTVASRVLTKLGKNCWCCWRCRRLLPQLCLTEKGPLCTFDRLFFSWEHQLERNCIVFVSCHLTKAPKTLMANFQQAISWSCAVREPTSINAATTQQRQLMIT